MKPLIVYGGDGRAAKDYMRSLGRACAMADARVMDRPSDPGTVSEIQFMPDVASWHARAIEAMHPGVRVSYVGAKAADVPASPPSQVVDNSGLAPGKGPGGRWYLKRGKEIVTGPFPTEEAAQEAARA